MKEIKVGNQIYLKSTDGSKQGYFEIIEVGSKFFRVEDHFWDQFFIDPKFRRGVRRDGTHSNLYWYYDEEECRLQMKLNEVRQFISVNLKYLSSEELLDIEEVIKERKKKYV